MPEAGFPFPAGLSFPAAFCCKVDSMVAELRGCRKHKPLNKIIFSLMKKKKLWLKILSSNIVVVNSNVYGIPPFMFPIDCADVSRRCREKKCCVLANNFNFDAYNSFFSKDMYLKEPVINCILQSEAIYRQKKIQLKPPKIQVCCFQINCLSRCILKSWFFVCVHKSL